MYFIGSICEVLLLLEAFFFTKSGNGISKIILLTAAELILVTLWERKKTYPTELIVDALQSILYTIAANEILTKNEKSSKLHIIDHNSRQIVHNKRWIQQQLIDL